MPAAPQEKVSGWFAAIGGTLVSAAIVSNVGLSWNMNTSVQRMDVLVEVGFDAVGLRFDTVEEQLESIQKRMTDYTFRLRWLEQQHNKGDSDAGK